MEKNPQQMLEELIQRELSKLPDREAPGTLMTRVFTQIEARQKKSWWQRPWTRWPKLYQLASLPLLISLAAATVLATSFAWRWATAKSSLEALTGLFDGFGGGWDVLATLGNAVLILLRGAGEQWLLLGGLIVLAMYLACVGLGTLCYRMAASHR